MQTPEIQLREELPKKAQSKTFTALNGLRFFAAMGVVLFHYAPAVRGFQSLPLFLQKLCAEGPVAVPFFFILSGFVLSVRYLNRGSGRVPSLLEYSNARFSRLYPAYFLAFLLFAPFAASKYLAPSAGGRNWALFLGCALLNILMLQAWTPLAQSWNGPSWSLSVEAFMYVVFPSASVRIKKLSNVAATVLIAIAWLLPAAIACAAIMELIPKPVWTSYIQNNPLLWTPLFLIGIAGVRFLEPFNRLSKSAASWATFAACFALITLAVAWPQNWLEAFITGGVAPLFLAIIIFFTRDSNWLTRVMGSNALDTLGQASYIIYIVQAPSWHYWQGATNVLRRVPVRTPVAEPWQFLLFLPFLVLFALAIERFVEIPVRRFLLGLGQKPAAAQPSSTRIGSAELLARN